jgi:hypothetical protein
VEERNQRIEQIAQQADQMTPTPEELQREAQEPTGCGSSSFASARGLFAGRTRVQLLD